MGKNIMVLLLLVLGISFSSFLYADEDFDTNEQYEGKIIEDSQENVQKMVEFGRSWKSLRRQILENPSRTIITQYFKWKRHDPIVSIKNPRTGKKELICKWFIFKFISLEKKMSLVVKNINRLNRMVKLSVGRVAGRNEYPLLNTICYLRLLKRKDINEEGDLIDPIKLERVLNEFERMKLRRLVYYKTFQRLYKRYTGLASNFSTLDLLKRANFLVMSVRIKEQTRMLPDNRSDKELLIGQNLKLVYKDSTPKDIKDSFKYVVGKKVYQQILR